MIIIHNVTTLPRVVGTALAERLKVMPGVVFTGARQTVYAGGDLCIVRLLKKI